MPIKKVFLSSTSKDLAEYREVAYKAVEGLDGYHCIRMEDFGARDCGIADFCSAKVIECDLFVGIVGHLHGSCPERSEKSYTELEYDAAVGAEISRLMFVAPEDFPLPASLRESQEKWDKQRIFRKRLGKDLIQSKFTSPDNLASEITSAIHNWEIQQRSVRIPFQAPPLPEHFIPRPEESKELKDRLLNFSCRSSGILVISAIHGLGGIGKTILATVLAHDPGVRNRFSDGILWATLGQEPDVLSLLNGWIQELGDYEFHPTTPKAATTHLRTLLQDKSMLLVVDDGWKITDVEPFLVSGSNCQVLITTRDSRIASAVGARSFELDVMTQKQSLALFSKRLNRRFEELEEKQALDLAKTVGYLPLALELAASQVEDGVPWIRLLEDLREEVAKLEALEMPHIDDVDESKRRYLSLKACFKLSLQRLPDYLISNFPWFGVFPEDVLLSSKMITTLWEIDERTVERDLRYLRSKSLLLSGPQLSEAVSTYRLHDLVHDLARNLLINPTAPLEKGDLPGLGLELQDAHRILLNRYRKKTVSNQWHTIPDDGYIHSHLLWHLEKAKQVEEIHALLQEETSESRNAWYETRDHLGQTGGFIEDIARAWRLTESTYEVGRDRQSLKISLEIRYALMTASVNSLASNVPSNLLAGMVKTNLWTLAQGLAYARLVPDLKHRDEALRRLQLCLSRPQDALLVAREITDGYLRSKATVNAALDFSEPQKTETLKEALKVTTEIMDEDQKAELQGTIAQKLPTTNEALSLAREIRINYRKAETLVNIGLNLSEPQKSETLNEALLIAHDTKDETLQTELLARIAPNLSRPQESLAVAREIKDGDRRAEVLAKIASNLPKDQLKEAIQVAKDIWINYPKEKVSRTWMEWEVEARNRRAEALARNQMTKALAWIAQNLPEPQDGLTLAKEIEDTDRRDEALARIALNMSKHLLEEALIVSAMIGDDYRRSKALSDIVLNLPNPKDALAVARGIQEKDLRIVALARISPSLPEPQKSEVMNEALSEVNEIVDEYRKAKTLAEILPNLPEPQKMEIMRVALASTKLIENASQIAEILVKIAPNLPGYLLKDALFLTKKIWDEDQKSNVLLRMAPSLPEPLLKDALEMTREFKDMRRKAETLLGIAPSLLEPQEIVDASRMIKEEYWRTEVLTKIDPDHLKPLLNGAFEIARRIEDDPTRAEALAGFAPNLFEPQEMLEVAKEIEDKHWRAEAMARIAPDLPEPYKIIALKEALEVAREIENEQWKEEILVKIVPYLPEPLLKDALKVAENIGYDNRRAKVLTMIVSNLKDPKEMLQVAREIGDEQCRAKALTMIVPDLLDSKELLQAASGIRDEHWRAEALAGIAFNLPDALLKDALRVANNIWYWHWRVKALTGIARNLPDAQKATVMKEARKVTKKIRDNYWKAEALAWIAYNLLVPKESLEVAREIRNAPRRSEVLAKIALKFPESQKNALLNEAVEVAMEIRDEEKRAKCLQKLHLICRNLRGWSL